MLFVFEMVVYYCAGVGSCVFCIVFGCAVRLKYRGFRMALVFALFLYCACLE